MHRRVGQLGAFEHRLTETLIGWFMMSAESYAEKMVPLLFAPELDGRSGAMFNQKGAPILASQGFTPSHLQRFMDATDRLFQRVVTP